MASEEQSRKGIDEIAVIGNQRITFLRLLSKREQVYSVLQGCSNNSKDYDIRIENHKTGADVRITYDRPFSKLVFWALCTTLCPKPYVHIKIVPGEVFNWNITYQFYIDNITNQFK